MFNVLDMFKVEAIFKSEVLPNQEICPQYDFIHGPFKTIKKQKSMLKQLQV